MLTFRDKANAKFPGPFTLRSLIPAASFVGCADITISTVTAHSAECTPGCLFATLPGSQHHGRQFIPQALQRGAAAILTDFPLADISLPQVIVADVAKSYGQICQAMYGNPSRTMGIAGVTGTNGKSTTTWLLRSLLESASRPCGLVGTIEYSDGMQAEPSTLTTPDGLSLAQLLAAMRIRETRYAVMELSSHALDQSRAAGIGLDVAIVTNVTQDHLDYHPDLEAYVSAKKKIIESIKPGGILVLNADDPHWKSFIPEMNRRVRVLTFGLSEDADISAEILSLSPTGTHMRVEYGVERFECKTRFIGVHNVMNCLAAICGAIHLGLTPEEIQSGIEACGQVPGRMEAVDEGQNYQVFVDYAHTEDALQHALQTVRSLAEGQVILVAGAGGDRDRSKRASMGRVAMAADHVIFTSDNPRTECPQQIVDDLLAGTRGETNSPIVELDRQRAIEHAMELASPGDVVLVAGKGHEKYQVVSDQRIPFDDVLVCRQAIRRANSLTPQSDLIERIAG